MEENAVTLNDAARNRRIAVAVSGGGRSLLNFIEQQENSHYEVAAVIASRPDCKAVDIATAYKIPLFIEQFTAPRLAEIAAKLYPWLEEQRVGWIALAGFLKLFPLHKAWHDRTVNIHPALLPSYGGPGMYGDRVHAAVLAAGDLVSGATVHYVNERYDEGKIIAQITVPVQKDDDAHALAARVFAAECELYPQVVNMLIEGALPLPGHEIYRLNHEP